MIIALHGDHATPEMLKRDMGDLAEVVDLFFDADGWRKFDKQFVRLYRFISELAEPPLLIGYSRGGSVIAALSEVVELCGAIVYESPIIDSVGVGGEFPVLQIWNDHGAKYGKNKVRRQQAQKAEAIWSQWHQVTMLEGKGRHVKRDPLGHAWDVELNSSIRAWLDLLVDNSD